MDYEAMTAGGLQEECARRSLPSSRAAKAVMMQRLLDDDATRTEAPSEQGDIVPAPTEAVNDSATPEPVVTPPAAAPVSVFRKTFDAEPGGPDEETHLAYRQDILQAAANAGLTVRGDARLAESSGGVWVYEVSVRQGG
ncbi:hypothetical protein ACIA6D_23560 [Streptomyces cacaoi]